MEHGTDVIGGIGDTPLVELRRIIPADHARVLVKVESHNPTGSMKDRMALSVIDRAVESGRLPPSGKVVEYTGGSTGTSLAFVCAAKGFPITLVTSAAFSREKRDHMRALGAQVIEIESDDGRITKELIRAMMEKAAEIASAPTAFAADQFNNTDVAVGYAPLAEEVWDQTSECSFFADSGMWPQAWIRLLATSMKARGFPSVSSNHSSICFARSACETFDARRSRSPPSSPVSTTTGDRFWVARDRRLRTFPRWQPIAVRRSPRSCGRPCRRAPTGASSSWHAPGPFVGPGARE